MISVSKADYKLGKKLGFIPKNKITHSVHRRHYYMSEYDYERLLEVFKKNIKIIQ